LESKTYTPKKLTKDQIVSFLQQEPSKTNTEWGNEWGVSRERVRQFRLRFGLPTVKAFDHELFGKVIAACENSNGILNAGLFTHIPNFGIRTLEKWMNENDEVRRQVNRALKLAYQNAYFPTTKMCNSCETVLPVSKFYKSKFGRDKLMLKCKECDIKQVQYYYNKRNTPEVTVEEKKCSIYKEAGILPASFFHRSRKTSTGLQYNCIHYGKAYSKWKNRFVKANSIENDMQRRAELNLLGDWKKKAYDEGLLNLKKDLDNMSSTVENQQVFG